VTAPAVQERTQPGNFRFHVRQPSADPFGQRVRCQAQANEDLTGLTFSCAAVFVPLLPPGTLHGSAVFQGVDISHRSPRLSFGGLGNSRANTIALLNSC